MRRTRFVCFPCVVVVVIAILLASIGTAQAASVSGCGGWSIIANANPGGSQYDFSGVAAVSAKDAWAVGSYYDLSGRRALGLIEHWNGKAWVVKKSPEPSYHFNSLNAVAAIASNDVWAVGYYKSPNVKRQTLAEHWNGTAWSLVSSPNVGIANDLYSISADASNDVWAVGFYNNKNSTEQTLVEHWDGSSWSVVPSLNEGSGDNMIISVTAISPTDVWVVAHNQEQSFIEHWDGSSWTVVPPASPGTSSYGFGGIAAVSANDIWASGNYSKGIHTKTLIEHWNGNTWSIVSSPSPGTFLNGLGDMAVISANDIWDVGTYLNIGGSKPIQTLTEHWDGTAWSVVASPNVGSGDNLLNGASAVPGTDDVWTVGQYSTSQSEAGLTEFYC